MYFEYGEKEIDYLKKKDKKLGEAIAQIGMLKRPVEKDIFSAIIKAILGQQISAQATKTVFKRMCDELGCVSVNTLNKLEVAQIQAFGTTFKKAEYIKDFTTKVYTKDCNLNELYALSDEEIIRKLSSLKGIGVWSAEMVLISALQRQDVISFGDIAIHRGLRMLYRHKEITEELFARYAKRYSPYGSVASVYLWAIAAGALGHVEDPKKKQVNTKR